MTDDEIYQTISEFGNFILFIDSGKQMEWHLYKLGPNNIVIEETIPNIETIAVRRAVMDTDIPYAIIRGEPSKTFYGLMYYEGRAVSNIETKNPEECVSQIYNNFNFLFLTDIQKAERAIERSNLWKQVKDKIIVIFTNSDNINSPDFEFLTKDSEIAICKAHDNIDHICLEENKAFHFVANSKRENTVTIFKYIKCKELCGKIRINNNYAVIHSGLYKDDGIGFIEKTYKLTEQENIKNFLKEGI